MRENKIMSDIIYEGKSKLVCQGTDESTLLIRYKDTATAFNGEKKAELSGKGQLNAKISNIIYGYSAGNGIKTHLMKIIDDTSVLAMR